MNTQSGFIRTILIVVILIIVLSIFRVSLKSIFDNQFVKDNFSFVWTGITYVWDNFLGQPVMYVYNFFKDNIWAPSLESWQRISHGIAPRLLNEDAPQAPQ